MLEGLPGAGKSQVIKWVRRLFEEVLGWQHGREFICIASMNTMAALIGGMTIHSFGEVPIGDEQKNVKAMHRRDKPDVNSMFLKCESLRWLLLDEGGLQHNRIYLNILVKFQTAGFRSFNFILTALFYLFIYD